MSRNHWIKLIWSSQWTSRLQKRGIMRITANIDQRCCTIVSRSVYSNRIMYKKRKSTANVAGITQLEMTPMRTDFGFFANNRRPVRMNSLSSLFIWSSYPTRLASILQKRRTLTEGVKEEIVHFIVAWKNARIIRWAEGLLKCLFHSCEWWTRWSNNDKRLSVYIFNTFAQHWFVYLDHHFNENCFSFNMADISKDETPKMIYVVRI